MGAERRRHRREDGRNAHAAFADVYQRLVDPVYGYCLRRVSDPELAADLTGQVFTRALGAWDGHREGKTRSWIFAIARNTVIDHYRARRPHDQLLSEMPSEALSPAELAEAGETREALMRGLQGLNDRQQDVINLRMAGLTTKEIAAVTGLTVSAVKSHQARAFAQLREVLGPHWGDGK